MLSPSERLKKRWEKADEDECLNLFNTAALETLMTRKEDFNTEEYELICPGINRRSLQRALHDLIAKGIVI